MATVFSSKSGRIPLIAGNWKMNFTAGEAVDFAEKFLPLVKGIKDVEITICAPFTCIESLHSALSSSNTSVSAQNIFYGEEGTFTGEVSARMIKPFCKYVIVGHSERRKLFNETNLDANQKIKKALEHGISPIVCIGETLEERKAGKTKAVVEKMFNECFEGLSKEQMLKVVLTYEPVWAISKGKADIAKSQSTSPETAEEAHAFIRSLVAKRFEKDAAQKVRILYGGSMKPENVKQLMVQPDIDGGLVGAASLNPNSFAKVVKFRD